MEVDFVLDGCFGPTGAEEHAAAGFDHAGMAAEVGGGVGGRKIPDIDVFADEVVNAAEFALPAGVVPGAADGGDVLQPGYFGGDFLQFIAITKFVDMTGALHAEQAMLPGHGCAALFPILIDRANVADVGSDAGDGGEKEMVFAAAAEIECEAALSEAAEEKRSSDLHLVKDGSKVSLWNALDEEFEYGFVRRGTDGIRALEALFAVFDAEGSVLSGEIGEGAAGIDFQDEEIIGDIAAIENAGGKEFFRIGDQRSPREIGCATLIFVYRQKGTARRW